MVLALRRLAIPPTIDYSLFIEARVSVVSSRSDIDFYFARYTHSECDFLTSLDVISVVSLPSCVCYHSTASLHDAATATANDSLRGVATDDRTRGRLCLPVLALECADSR